jgi:hypothetical protein
MTTRDTLAPPVDFLLFLQHELGIEREAAFTLLVEFVTAYRCHRASALELPRTIASSERASCSLANA